MAFLDPTANFARTTLSVGITSIATTMTLTSGTAFPDPDVAAYNVIIYNETDYPAVYNDPNVEIVRATSETAGVYTITRGQEGTTASAHNTVGKTYGVILAPTDKTMDDIEAYLQGKAAADIASATTTDIGAVKGTYVKITGTTTITGLGSATGGTTRIVTFGGILTLTHNVTAIVLPTAANITTAAGDRAIFVSESPGVWLCASYQRYDGTALAAASGGSATAIDSATGAWWNMQIPPNSALASGSATYTGIIEYSASADGQALQYYLPSKQGGTSDKLLFSDIKRVICRLYYRRTSGTAKMGFGFSDQGSYVGDAVTAAGVRACFTWDDASVLYAVTSDGAGTPTSTSISSPPTSGNWNEYIVDYDKDSSTCKFYVNGTLKATHTTELPVSGDTCRFVIGTGGSVAGSFSYPIVSIKMT